MNTHADKTRENKSQSVSAASSWMQNGGESTFQFVDNRPEAVAQRKLQEIANNSPQLKQVAQLQAMAHNYSPQQQPIQEKENNMGLPDNIKVGIEKLSGYSMDDVKVHYNSDKPAQLQAHAYAQGTDIHIASGQEKHLPHEAWHVVQQKQGRVKPTTQMKGKINVNDDAGLEKEADLMGTTAAQMKANNNDSNFSTSRPIGPKLYGIVQMVRKEIGAIDNSGQPRSGIIDHLHVIAEFDKDNTYHWPTALNNHFFDTESYGGSVTRAMEWGATAGEGTAGWYTRPYTPKEFHNLAVGASTASQGLNAPALNNESNKTLIAIRTFRSSNMDMANQTAQDLQAVLNGVNALRGALANAGMIANPADNIQEVKADPAEAHPNTLPTAKITLDSGETLYFKGRSGGVESALIGTNKSAAQVISALGANNALSEVGTHSFISEDHAHISKDVGTSAPHDQVTQEEAIRAWLSAARTAALVSLTGTGDLHGSNVIDGATATKHIIDAEFLLDSTSWDRYEAASQKNEIPNFAIDSMAPQWVKDHTSTLNTVEKLQLSDTVALRFQAMNLNNDGVLEQILAPVRALIENEVLLRVSPEPFTTAFWLTTITAFHESNEDEIDNLMDKIWDDLVKEYPKRFHIDIANRNNVLQRLRANFRDGMVPLFHIGANTGTFYLNKDTYMGAIRQDRSTDRFLDLTKIAIVNGYDNMVLKIRAAIIDCKN